MSATQVPFALPVRPHNYPGIYILDPDKNRLAEFTSYEVRDEFLRRINNHAALVEALKKIIDMNRQHAHDQYGDAEKAETWACVTVAREALHKAGEGK